MFKKNKKRPTPDRFQIVFQNSRRLAACWHACEGISTEDLEAGVIGHILALQKGVIEAAHNIRRVPFKIKVGAGGKEVKPDDAADRPHGDDSNGSPKRAAGRLRKMRTGVRRERGV